MHAARFLLVGTMNVEEGRAAAALLDRFGLGVEVRGPVSPRCGPRSSGGAWRSERDPERFAADWRGAEEALAHASLGACCLAARPLSERELQRIVAACAALGIGVRGDIVTARTARARPRWTATTRWGGAVRRAAAMALLHRRRRDPLDGATPSPDDIERALDDQPPDDQPPGARRRAAGVQPIPSEGARAPARGDLDAPAPARLPAEALRIAGTGSGPVGRRARSSGLTAGAIDSRGATPGSTDIAIVATLRARLAGEDPRGLREHVRGGRESVLLCLVVDASGSMGARARLARVKGALLELLSDASARRDRVAVVALRDREGHLLVPPGAPLEVAAEAIGRLATGGRTPLAEGLALAEQVVSASRRATAAGAGPGDPHRRARQDPAGAVRRAAASPRPGHRRRARDRHRGRPCPPRPLPLAQAAGARLHTLTTRRECRGRRTTDPFVPASLARHGGGDVDVPHRPGDQGSLSRYGASARRRC